MSLLAQQLALLPAPLAQAVARSRARADEVIVESRDGLCINGLVHDSRPVLFHSRYAAAREADRIAESTAHAGYVVALGMGMGHHLVAIARRSARVVCIEPDPALVRSALERTDMTDLLRVGRLVIEASTTPDALVDQIAADYVPALHGTLACTELPGRVQADRDGMRAARAAVTSAIESIKNDLAVQARFGRMWMRNAILNLAGSTIRTLPDFGGSRVIVAAAGPSLEDAMHELADPLARTIAVDTALPVLSAHHVRPDLVLTVDCQSATYHHYLAACLPNVPMVADLSASPSVFSRMGSVLPVLSDHPLHGLFRRLGCAAPYVDARGGNVTQAAVDLAVRCGAGSIRLVGADYSYPDGATYARGSYLHRLFASVACRLAPQEARHYRFLLERPGLRRDTDRPSRLLQPLLLGYAASMERFAASLPVPVSRRQDRGVDLRLPLRPPNREPLREPFPPRRAEPPETILAEASRLFSEIRDPTTLQAALGSPNEPISYAARALLPLLAFLSAADPDADPAVLVSRARDETTALFETGIARLQAGEPTSD